MILRAAVSSWPSWAWSRAARVTQLRARASADRRRRRRRRREPRQPAPSQARQGLRRRRSTATPAQRVQDRGRPRRPRKDRANRKGLVDAADPPRSRRCPSGWGAAATPTRTVRVPFHKPPPEHCPHLPARRSSGRCTASRRSGRRRRRASSIRPPFRVVWSRGVGSLIEFPAVVSEGVAFIANQRGHVWAVSMRDGKVVWRRDTRRQDGGVARRRRRRGRRARDETGNVWMLDRCNGRDPAGAITIGSPIESSPVVRDGVDYFGAWNGVVYALDLSGASCAGRTGPATRSPRAQRSRPATVFIGDYGGTSARSQLAQRQPALGRLGRTAGSTARRRSPAGRVFVPSSTGGSLTAFSTARPLPLVACAPARTSTRRRPHGAAASSSAPTTACSTARQRAVAGASLWTVERGRAGLGRRGRRGRHRLRGLDAREHHRRRRAHRPGPLPLPARRVRAGVRQRPAAPAPRLSPASTRSRRRGGEEGPDRRSPSCSCSPAARSPPTRSTSSTRAATSAAPRRSSSSRPTGPSRARREGAATSPGRCTATTSGDARRRRTGTGRRTGGSGASGRAPCSSSRPRSATAACTSRTPPGRFRRRRAHRQAGLALPRRAGASPPRPALSRRHRLHAFLNQPPCNRNGRALTGEVVALDAGTGKVRWRKEIGPSETSPLLWRGLLYVGDWSGIVYGYDGPHGRAEWTYRTGGKVKGAIALRRRTACTSAPTTTTSTRCTRVTGS